MLLRRARNGIPAVVFALPVLLIFLLFSWGPIVRGLVMSLQQTNLIDPVRWVGLENFRYVLTDPAVGQASLNTVWFTLLALLFGFPLPILLAMFLSELRGRNWAYTTLAYLPVITPPVVAILLWRFFYEPSVERAVQQHLRRGRTRPVPLARQSGICDAVDRAGGDLGRRRERRDHLSGRADLGPTRISTRRPSWTAPAYSGAVWHVMLPHLRGVLLLMLLLQVIGTMQLFTEPLLFTGGGPQGRDHDDLLLIYNYAFVNGDYGAATALSVLLAVVLAVLSAGFHLATRAGATG